MKLYAFNCTDGERGAMLRERHLQAHLDHVEAHVDRYAVAGPLKGGDTIKGSLIIVRAEDEDAARSFFERDPYFHAGVWQAIRVEEFKPVAGNWVGGVAWREPPREPGQSA